jgi:hypothetical protein
MADEDALEIAEREYFSPAAAAEGAPRIRAISAAELLDMDIPEPVPVLEPWLHEEQLALVYAPRGMGKTLFMMGAAAATASGGGFLGWNAPEPRNVLYVDGELPLARLRERVQLALRTVEGPKEDPREFLRLISPGINRTSPNIAEESGRKMIEDHLEGVGLLVLDALSTLCRSGVENDAESWQPIQDWIVRLRSTKLPVLVGHHAGKSGLQRGTSKREDVFDWIINLRKPSDYLPSQGARFEVHFEKTRGFVGGRALDSFEAGLENHDGHDLWAQKCLTAANEERILRLRAEGLTQRQIADELGIGLASVNRALKKADEASTP